MKERAKNLAARVVFPVYRLIFNKEPGPLASKFMKNLGFIFLGLITSKMLSVIFQIYMGRAIGVAEYGKFALINSISAFLWLPMFISLGTAMVKYLSEQKTMEAKRAIISTGLTLVLIFTAIFSVLFYILSPQLAYLTSVNTIYIFAAIVLTLCYVTWIATQRICQGLDRIKKLSALNVILYSATLVSAVVLAISLGDVRAPIIGLCIGYIAASIFIIPELRKYFRPGIDRKWAKTLLTFGAIGFVGGICFAINENLNKIFINIFLTLSDVGLYQAYYFSTITIVAFFVTGFILVFFPEAAKYEKKIVIFRQMGRAMRFAPILYLLLSAISTIVLLLYGSEYALMFPLLLLFILAAVIYAAYSLYMWLSISIGVKGVKMATYSLALISFLNIILAYILIPQFKLYGAIASIIVAYIAGLILIRVILGNYLSSEEQEEGGLKNPSNI